ncbi:phytoene desaturase family protein [Aurantibacillus circumpalustris]|uniref:phytoene desaturase family protein n=1 Tax=Aurantibacillus circumpalustris TaxID=3036359 RepID=UPI00295BBDEC|nr:NAD(P)/FAD-dependent oxidoreductase [Aurantibacillus circumpalustris]
MENSEFDTIIIGSGAGGLTAAICLAKAGQKVLVLEQHYVPGGWCHSFHLNGQRFSPGVHYIGLLDEGQSTSNLYKALGIANELVFFRMNPKAYEHCLVGNQKIDMPAGIDALYESLAKRFPAEKKGLKKYLSTVEKVSQQVQLIPKMKGFMDHLTIPFRTKDMGKYGLFSLKRVIDWHIKDPLLKSILNVQCGDHGLPPSKASFPVHCVVMFHYFSGAFYPMGGGAGIVKAMTNALKKNGGEVRVKQSVKKILLENKKAIGVELKDGQKIFAKNIVSNTDPTATFFNLVGKENISNNLIKKLNKTKYSVTSLILFLTLDMDLKSAGLDSGNIWYLKTDDLEKIYNELKGTDIGAGEEFPGVFISCPTLKDPVSFNGRYHTLEVVTFIDNESFDKFEKGTDYHSDAYTAQKEIIKQKFLNTVEKIIPGAKKHLVHAELGTPSTNKYYIQSTKGNVYGTEKNLMQVGPFSFNTKSEIENLFLCGASTISHGVGGAAYSGVEAASKILQMSQDEILKPQENQKLRIYEAEDSSTWPDFVHQKIEDKKRRFKEVTL